MDDVRDRQAALLVHALHPAQAGAGHGGAVVAVVAGDEDVLARLVLHRPVVPHQAQDGVVGFRAGVDEEGVIQIVRRQLGQLGRQADGGLGGALEEAVVVGQLLHLPRGGPAQLGAAIADVDAPQPGEGVEQLVAFGIPDVAALAAGQDARALGGQRRVVVERMQMVGGIEVLQGAGLVGIHGLVLLACYTVAVVLALVSLSGLDQPRRPSFSATSKNRHSRESGNPWTFARKAHVHGSPPSRGRRRRMIGRFHSAVAWHAPRHSTAETPAPRN